MASADNVGSTLPKGSAVLESSGYVDRQLRRISVVVGVLYGACALVAGLDGAVGATRIILCLAVFAWAVLALGGLVTQSVLWRWSMVVSGAAVWVVIVHRSNQNSLTVDVDILDPTRPLAIGMSGTVLGLGLRSSRAAATWSVIAAVASLGAGRLAGAGLPVTLSGALWAFNVAGVCVVAGAVLRHSAKIADQSWVLLEQAKHNRRVGEAHLRAQVDRATDLHDNALATLTMLSHDGRGIAPDWLRQRCASDADDLAGAAPEEMPTLGAPDETVAMLTRRWAATAVRLGLRLQVIAETHDAGVESVTPATHVMHVTGDGASSVNNPGGVRLPSLSAAALGRAVDEALRNVKLHAGTSDVTVTTGYHPQRGVRVTVRDHGVGFDLSGAKAVDHYGLQRSISAAVRRAGGTVRVSSTLGEGTSVSIRFPPSGGPSPARSPESHSDTVATFLNAGRLAMIAIGTVGLVDAAVTVAVFWARYSNLGAAVAALSLLLVLAGCAVGPRKTHTAATAFFRYHFLLVASGLMAVTVVMLLVTVPEYRFGQANFGVTAVSLCLSMLYLSYPVRTVLALGILHTLVLLGGLIATAQSSGTIVFESAQLVATSLVVPVGLGILLRRYEVDRVKFEVISDELARGAARDDGTNAARAEWAVLVSGFRAQAVEFLRGVASGSRALPLTDDDATTARHLAAQVRNTLGAAGTLTWLSVAVTGGPVVGAFAPVRVIDGRAAADAIAPGARDAVVAVVQQMSVAVARGTGSVTVIVEPFPNGVTVVVSAQGRRADDIHLRAIVGRYLAAVEGTEIDRAEDRWAVQIEFSRALV